MTTSAAPASAATTTIATPTPATPSPVSPVPSGGPPTAAAAPSPRFVLQYMYGPAYDFVFFLTPFWASLVYAALIALFPAYQGLIFVLAYIALLESHFGSTWTIYLDGRNRQEYNKRPLVYYVVPLVIMVASALIAYDVSLSVVLFIGSAISTIHLSRQSVGIVALYRGKVRQFDPPSKRWENFSIYAATATFAGLGFLRFYAKPGAAGGYSVLADNLASIVLAAQVAVGVAGAATLFCLAMVAVNEIKRYRAKQPISLSKLLVLTYSLFLYAPYSFASRIEHAIIIGVAVHYLQYLGIVWLLNKNKYQPVAGAAPVKLDRKILEWLSQKLWVRLPYLAVYGGIMALLRQDGFQWDHLEPKSWLYCIPIGLQIVHYHIDAYIWKFSTPFIRETVLPYLKRV